MTWDVMRDESDGVYIVRGHVDAAAYADAVAGYLGVPYGALAPVGDVAHDWMRFVPSSDPDDGGGAYWPAKAGARGAFPVTYGWVDGPDPVEAPAPGSDAALALGCTCPVLDNGHGRGYAGGGYVMTVGCPLHGGGR